jgi:hypothetical protein
VPEGVILADAGYGTNTAFRTALGHAGFGAANRIGRPILGKIETKGDREACICRQRDRDLTIVLLAKLAAILPGDADRMNALL